MKVNGTFKFRVTLPEAATESSYVGIRTYASTAITPTTETLPVNSDGHYIEFTLQHKQSMTITGLPADAAVTVEELGLEGSGTNGYSVSWSGATADGADALGTTSVMSANLVTDADPTAEGDQPIAITCTNTTGYALPSTGGIGTTLYTMSGMAMMSAALVGGYGLRRKRERGSEE